jgi:hypothetical protein
MSDAIPHQHERYSGIGTGRILAWVLLLGVMSVPRLFMLGLWIFSDLVGDAISSTFVCVMGFVLLPWTTLTYAMMWSINSDTVSGWEWLAVAFAFFVDLLTWLGARTSLSFD